MCAIARHLLCAIGLCTASGAIAQGVTQTSWLPDAVFVQGAAGEHTHAYCGGAQWRLREAMQIGSDLSATAHLELVAGRWRAQTSPDGDAHRWTNQFGAVPTIRVRSTRLPGWYLDVGVGPSYLTPRFRNQDKTFSSRFQFRSHLGLGIQMGGRSAGAIRHDFEIRIEHFSNAGYEQPNPGVNLIAFRYTYLF